MAGSKWVVDVTAENFDEVVVAGSKERPVVVDFWASWCGPCRTLGPRLEVLATERDGEFLLAKVNTDDNPEIAQSFQVEGIPAVFGIRDGKVLSQFTGVVPDEQLHEFLASLAPSESETAAANALELEGRDPKAAEAAYRAILAADAKSEVGRVGLARVLLMPEGNEAEARDLLKGLDIGDYVTEAGRLRAIISLRAIPHADPDLESARKAVHSKPDDAEALRHLGAVLAARGSYTEALQSLLAAADSDRTIGKGPVRELMLNVFEIIGPRSPEAEDYRKKLQMLLY